LEHVIKPQEPVVARVNGEEISTSSFLDVMKRQLQVVTMSYGVDWNDVGNQELIPGFQDQILDQMVQDQLIRQLAAAEGIVVTDADIEAERASIEAEVLASGQYADWDAFLTSMGSDPQDFGEQIKTYLCYQKLLVSHGGPTEAEQVHAQHILVDTEEIGQEVLKKLQGGTAFADLAKEYSTDTGSAESGGDLGWFPRGVMVTEFEDAAFGLSVGETSELVKTDFGYHIIQVLEKGLHALSEDLLADVQQENFGSWFDEEYSKANIETLVIFANPEPTPTATS
jgi:foldase protein PrsA